ncbi:hypothetical protein O181_095312, partial [Austropuccinia psidii MF-1]|nr:hypothetical protein [Austropuccinia psidii MF-1]
MQSITPQKSSQQGSIPDLANEDEGQTEIEIESDDERQKICKSPLDGENTTPEPKGK